MVYWSGKIPSVLSQAVNPLCPSTVKYIGKSETYKGKMRNQDISVFGLMHNFVEYIRWLAAFLRS